MIRIDNMTYPKKGIEIFSGISVEFDSSHKHVILGPSGSGKTTLLRILSGLESKYTGSVRFNNQILERNSTNFIFQDLALWPHLTVRQHITISNGNRALTDKQVTLLDKVKLNHKLDALPASLSGGEQQRLAIARALATEPKVLFMDEPFSSLDFMLKAQLLGLLRSLSEERDMTIFYVTHNLDEARQIGDTVTFLVSPCSMIQLSKNQFHALTEIDIRTTYYGC
ncbi:ATP-binding cassette domain-containing protein [Vibrio agarivorans]|uniref:ATP-binding cassette domain-containing protein n=1 Tax=Vibrio agarivorans TaxID=153622 RepID=A0ABT7Y0E2_9VIBR|nr:ATP-binding cassette domain-containing protein [Vibrio agarivorans]MDN2481509.1 ATP-binding cassette domain-containing protein [Vibrio agarivorans]